MAMKPWRRTGGLAPRGREYEYPLESVRNEMDRLFDEFWRGFGQPALAEVGRAVEVFPRLDITEDEKAYHISAELPGMEEKDISVDISEGLLNIRGEKREEKEEKERTYYRRERSFGSFQRAIPLPGSVDEDKIEAHFKNGVLTVDLPKLPEAESKAKRIEVKGG